MDQGQRNRLIKVFIKMDVDITLVYFEEKTMNVNKTVLKNAENTEVVAKILENINRIHNRAQHIKSYVEKKHQLLENEIMQLSQKIDSYMLDEVCANILENSRSLYNKQFTQNIEISS